VHSAHEPTAADLHGLDAPLADQELGHLDCAYAPCQFCHTLLEIQTLQSFQINVSM
jgi:hypothetical protein